MSPRSNKTVGENLPFAPRRDGVGRETERVKQNFSPTQEVRGVKTDWLVPTSEKCCVRNTAEGGKAGRGGGLVPKRKIAI